MNGFKEELASALTCAEQLAAEKSAEIIKQEWPKIQQSFGQLIADGERDMKFSIDVFLNSESEGIGVKAAMTCKIVHKARVSEAFARFDGTVQQELPLRCAAGEQQDATDTPVNLEETARSFGFVTVGGEPDMEALFSAAKGIFTTAARNSSFLLIRQIGVSLPEAQAIMETMRNAGELDAAFDPLPGGEDEAPETEEPANESEPGAGATGEQDTEPVHPDTEKQLWNITPEEHAALLDKAVDVLKTSSRARPNTLYRKFNLTRDQSEDLFKAAMVKIEESNAATCAVPPSIIEKHACVDCARFDECQIARPAEESVMCESFAAKDGAQ